MGLNDATVRAAADQVWSQLGSEAVILNLRTGVYHGLEGSAVRAWELLQTPTTMKEILETMLKEFDVDRDRLGRELEAFFDEMTEHGLIEVAHAAAA